MAIQKINLGTEPLGEGGDTYRSANTKINENFSNPDHAASHLVDKNLYASDPLIADSYADRGGAKLILQHVRGGIGGTGIGGLKDIRAKGTYADREPDTRLIHMTGLSAEIDTSSNLNIDTQKGSVRAGTGFVLNLGGYFNMGGSQYMGRVVFSYGRMFVQDVNYTSSYKETYGTRWGEWNEFYSTGNTTKEEGTGYIVASSPVLKMQHDSFEKVHEAEQLDIEVNNIKTGVYEITGTTGLREGDGWNLKPPKDVNGNVLCICEASESNGVITLKTYKKKFDFETVSIVADYEQPTDIPEGAVVMLRFNDLPQETLDEDYSV